MIPKPLNGDAPQSNLREELSALMDGEIDDSALAACVGRLCADEAARHDWMIWHCVSDALRSSEVAACHSEAFTARVGGALRVEPHVLAPPARFGRARLVRRMVLPGAAAAAAAAVLAVIVIPQLRGTAPAGAELARTAPASQTVSLPVVDGELRRSPELEMYLEAHRELATGAVIPRATPYLRASVRESEAQR